MVQVRAIRGNLMAPGLKSAASAASVDICACAGGLTSAASAASVELRAATRGLN